jgi:HEAT repeat protein
MKLMALNGLMNSDPDRAVPLLEKLLHSSQSPKVKERALFVLTQSGSPRARQIVVQLAKGGANPDVQMKAVNYLGVMGAKQELGEVYAATSDVAVKRVALNALGVAGAKDQVFAAARSEKDPDLQRMAIHQLGVMGAKKELGEIYGLTNDVSARRAVLNSFMVSGAKDQLLAAAKSEKNAELRHFAINQLGVLGAQPELWQLYQVEPSLDIKRQLVNAFFVGGASDRLLEIARTAKEPELRRDAISRLGNMGEEHTGAALASMYAGESDPAIRKAIIHGLFVQGNSHALVELARKETNVELKKEIVRCLSNMGSKEGTDYLMELLNK